MRRRTVVGSCSVAVVMGVLLGAGPASAVPLDQGATALTFTVTEGTLDITTPSSADLGSANTGTLAGNLGTVTVTDARRAADASWSVQVNAREFWGDITDISSDSASYWSGPATDTSGNGTFTPGQLTADDAQAFGNGSFTAFTHSEGTGINTAAWNPVIIVRIPEAAVADSLYEGEATHSVT